MNWFLAGAALLIAVCVVYPLYDFSRKQPDASRGAKMKAGAIALSVLLAAVLLYAVLGNRAALDPAQNFTRTGDAMQFVNAVDALEKKARENPDDLQQQVMLARSYRAMGRYEDAVAAYGRAWDLIKNNAQELAQFAGVLAVYRGSFDGKPDELLQDALKLDPQNIDALMMAGGSAFEKEQFQPALQYWETARQVPGLDGEDKAWIETQIEQVKKALDGNKDKARTLQSPKLPDENEE